MLLLATVLVTCSQGELADSLRQHVLDSFYTRTPSGYVLSHCVHHVEHGADIRQVPEGGLLVTEGSTIRVGASQSIPSLMRRTL